LSCSIWVTAMGNKACSALSGRSSATIDAPLCAVPAPASQRTEPSAKKEAAEKTESLEWLNDILAAIWPKVNEAVQKIVHDQVTPQIQAKLPGPLKKTHFKHFTLGTVTPQLGPIKVTKRKNGLKVTLMVDYQSDVDIEISAVVASIGIKAIKLTGELVIRMEPFMDDLPVVGGITAYFVDAPELDLEFTGIGHFADCPGIAGLIRNEIRSVIGNALVLPNSIAVPVGTPEQGVDPALLKLPLPIAVLRVTALRASALTAKNWHIMTKATSDPFVKVHVANEFWQSSVQKGTCDPIWTADDVHDFMVFDRDQQVWIEVYDQGLLHGTGLIGKVSPLKVSKAVNDSEQPLKLSAPKVDQPCGSLELKFEWLDVVPLTAASQSCVVMVKILNLSLPPELGTSAGLSATLCELTRCTAVVPAKPGKAAAAVGQELVDVAKRCKARSMDNATIAQITGLSEDAIKDALATGAAADTCHVAAEIELDATLYFSVAREGLDKQELMLTVVDKQLKPFASTALNMLDLLAAETLTLPGPYKLCVEGGHGHGHIEAQIEVSVFGAQ